MVGRFFKVGALVFFSAAGMASTTEQADTCRSFSQMFYSSANEYLSTAERADALELDLKYPALLAYHTTAVILRDAFFMALVGACTINTFKAIFWNKSFRRALLCPSILSFAFLVSPSHWVSGALDLFKALLTAPKEKLLRTFAPDRCEAHR